MNDELDIIPIHVFCSSANRAEMLNGRLRGQGLAVKPLWCPRLNETEGDTPEIVFYFADNKEPSLEDVAAYAARDAAALIVIAQKYDPEAAACAIAAGADDWIQVDQDVLLAAAVRRARELRRERHRAQQMERQFERNRQLLEQQFSHSEDAIATMSEGILVEANTTWAKRFGYASVEALAGVPIMDLFAAASQPVLKRGIRKLHKQQAPQTLAGLFVRGNEGDKSEVELGLELLSGAGESPLTRIRIRGDATQAKAGGPPAGSATKAEPSESGDEHSAPSEPDSHLLRPGFFAPLASRLLSQPQTGVATALVFLRPAEPDSVRHSFGAIGVAELGVSLGTTFSTLLEKGDLATRSADVNLIALIVRRDEQALETWIKNAVTVLGEKIFEGGGYSGTLGFAAGYVAVNRTRRLDALVRQASEITTDQIGSVTRDQPEVVTMDIDDESWEALIREALEEHRYTVALCPIEDLASGERGRVALPCLLDRAGEEIAAASFQPPALRLGLLSVLEHRFVGNALRALLKSRPADKISYMIAPLHADSLTDERVSRFLGELFEHASKPPPAKSLILELDIAHVADKLREAEKFAKRVQKLHCAFGLRNYAPSPATDKLIEHLPIECLRLAPDLTERLLQEEALSARLAESAAWLKQRQVRTIATGVGDSATMAQLYNLGLSSIQGPIIGEAELLSPARPDGPKTSD